MDSLFGAGRCVVGSKGCERKRFRRPVLGFTLIELLTVIALVGLLAGLAMFKIDTFRDQTRLRQSAEKVHQILSHAKLRCEKSGIDVIARISLPALSIYLDKNADGKWQATDSLLVLDSALSKVAVFKPAVGPSEASVAAPASGRADGAGTCGSGVCCTKASGTTPTWSDTLVNFCARTSPSLPPLIEDGAIYLASSNSNVKEKWAIVMNRAKGVEPSLWTSDKDPVAATDWRKVR